MKIKFRIRTILLLTLVFGIALACLRWVQQERIAENRNLKDLIFIGQSSGLSITELKQLGHLNWLALDENLLDPQAKEALTKALPDTNISFHSGARQ